MLRTDFPKAFEIAAGGDQDYPMEPAIGSTTQAAIESAPCFSTRTLEIFRQVDAVFSLAGCEPVFFDGGIAV